MSEPLDLPTCWIFDMDGTLALLNGRSPYNMKAVALDLPNAPVIQLAQAIAAHPGVDHIVISSGRTEEARRATQEWLGIHGVPFSALFMRPDGDQRRDAEVKEEILDRDILPHYRVLGVVDDRQQVVDMWRKRGFTCLQAAPGQF